MNIHKCELFWCELGYGILIQSHFQPFVCQVSRVATLTSLAQQNDTIWYHMTSYDTIVCHRSTRPIGGHRYWLPVPLKFDLTRLSEFGSQRTNPEQESKSWLKHGLHTVWLASYSWDCNLSCRKNTTAEILIDVPARCALLEIRDLGCVSKQNAAVAIARM